MSFSLKSLYNYKNVKHYPQVVVEIVKVDNKVGKFFVTHISCLSKSILVEVPVQYYYN